MNPPSPNSILQRLVHLGTAQESDIERARNLAYRIQPYNIGVQLKLYLDSVDWRIVGIQARYAHHPTILRRISNSPRYNDNQHYCDGFDPSRSSAVALWRCNCRYQAYGAGHVCIRDGRLSIGSGYALPIDSIHHINSYLSIKFRRRSLCDSSNLTALESPWHSAC